MKNKVKIILNILTLMILIVFIIFITPKFLNFMETQNDILKIKNEEMIILNDVTENVTINTIAEPKIEIKSEETQTKEEKVTSRSNKKRENQSQNNSTQKSSVSQTQNGYIKFEATAYCPCKQCCGKTNGITASGAKAKAGVTVAMPSKYKFGTKIEIKGMGTYIVQDRGGAINGNRIDIFFNTHQEALKFGRRTVYLRVVE